MKNFRSRTKVLGYRAVASVFTLLFLSLSLIFADTDTSEMKTWTDGAKDYNWSTAGNWSDHAVPDDQAQVRINGNSTETNPIKYSSGKGVRDLYLDAGYLELTGGSLPISLEGLIGNSTETARVTIDANATLGIPYVGLEIGTVAKATAIVVLHGGTLTGNITVGANPAATALVKGYGTISSVNQGSNFTLKGQLVADGGTLTLARVNPIFPTAQNDADNAGWYAISGGKIVTPDATTADKPLFIGPTGEGVWVWGDQAADGSDLTMVNSVAIHYKAADPTVVRGLAVSLLANDNVGAHPAPAGTTFIGYWTIATAKGSTDLALLGLSFRFDQALTRGNDPLLYFWNGTAWDKLSSQLIKPAFICYYAGSDELMMGDYALGIGSAPSPGQK